MVSHSINGEDHPIIHCMMTSGKRFSFSSSLMCDSKLLFQKLENNGAEINPLKETLMLLQIYFRLACKGAPTAKRSELYGWSPRCDFFGLPSGYAAKKAGSRYCYGSGNEKELAPIDQSKLKSWQDNIAQYALVNARGAIALGCAFAAPLLRRLNWSTGFGVHFYGESSCGKTILQKIANTVFGDPDEDATLPTWNATRTAIDEMLKQANDMPIIFDDIEDQALDPKVVYQTMYGIPSGRSRSKCNSSSDLQTSHKWKTVLISSGERDMRSFLKPARIDINAGQLVRVLNINCRDTYGAFDNLPDWFSGIGEFVQCLQTNLSDQKHYGVAGQAYVESLLRIGYNTSALLAMYKEVSDLADKWLSMEISPQGHRALSNIKLMFLGLKLAHHFCITGQCLEEIMTPALKAVVVKILGVFGKKSYELKSFHEKFVHKLLSNQFKRFLHENDMSTSQDIWGYRDDNFFYVLPLSFRDELCKGADAKVCAQELADKDILVTNCKTPERMTVLWRYAGEMKRVYKVKMSELIEQ